MVLVIYILIILKLMVLETKIFYQLSINIILFRFDDIFKILGSLLLNLGNIQS